MQLTLWWRSSFRELRVQNTSSIHYNKKKLPKFKYYNKKATQDHTILYSLCPLYQRGKIINKSNRKKATTKPLIYRNL